MSIKVEGARDHGCSDRPGEGTMEIVNGQAFMKPQFRVPRA